VELSASPQGAKPTISLEAKRLTAPDMALHCMHVQPIPVTSPPAPRASRLPDSKRV
jgi:hypothetical protein